MATSSKRPTGEKRKEKVDWAAIPAFEVQDVKISDHSYLDAESLNAFSIGIFTGLFKDDKDTHQAVSFPRKLDPGRTKGGISHCDSKGTSVPPSQSTTYSTHPPAKISAKL